MQLPTRARLQHKAQRVDASELRGPGLRRESTEGERESLGDNEGLVLGEEGRQLGDEALLEGGCDLAHRLALRLRQMAAEQPGCRETRTAR